MLLSDHLLCFPNYRKDISHEMKRAALLLNLPGRRNSEENFPFFKSPTAIQCVGH